MSGCGWPGSVYCRLASGPAGESKRRLWDAGGGLEYALFCWGPAQVCVHTRAQRLYSAQRVVSGYVSVHIVTSVQRDCAGMSGAAAHTRVTFT